MIKTKRVYLSPEREDGYRVLVERLWPRGLTKEAAHVDAWHKEVAPSTALRKWYGHDEARWPEFQARYRAELDACPALDALRALLRAHPVVTFVYAARGERNSAVVLADYLAR